MESQRWRSAQPSNTEATGGHMVLDFSEAMHTFRAMFPNIDDDVIEQVLRSHGGSVDPTIDSLLKMSSAPSQPAKSTGSYHGSSHRSKMLSNDNTVEDVSDSIINLSFTDIATSSRWKPAMLRPLPSDFLVISPNLSDFSSPSGVSSGNNMLRDLNSDTLSRRLRENEELRVNAATAGMEDGDLQSFLEDERLAIMLQNEEFLRMLSQDEDFMESMNQEQGLSNVPSSSSRYAPSASSLPLDHPYYHESRQDELHRMPDIGAFPYTATTSRSENPNQRRLGPDMTKHMGHTTKVKLAKLAKKFFSKKALSGKKSASHGLPSPDTKSNPLLDDDELANASNGGHSTLPNVSSYGRF